MACPIPRPTLQSLWDRIANSFSANVLGGAPIIPESNEWYVVSNDVLAQDAFHAMGERMWAERDPRQACCDNLVAMAADRKIFPHPARRAQGYVTLTGVAGATITAPLTFSIGGVAFETSSTATVPASIGADGRAVVPVVAATAGSAGNTISSAAGTMITSLANVDAAVTVCGSSMCGGRDAETCEQFRTRYIARMQYRPKGDLQWAIDALMDGWPCITRVCVRNCGCCPEVYRVEFYPFMDTTFPHGIIPATVLQDIQTWFFGATQGLGTGQVPFGVYGQLYSPVAAPVNIVIGGLECLPTAAINTIRSEVSALLDARCPAELLCLRTVELAVARIAGTGCNFTVALEPASTATGLAVTSCGDIQPDCDVMPVLGTVEIAGSYCG